VSLEFCTYFSVATRCHAIVSLIALVFIAVAAAPCPVGVSDRTVWPRASEYSSYGSRCLCTSRNAVCLHVDYVVLDVRAKLHGKLQCQGWV